MIDARTSNLLGALGLAIADRQSQICTDLDIHPSDIAALTTLGQHSGMTVGALAPIVGFTRSAAVRLVERLSAEGLVTRTQGQDKREVRLTLTNKGADLRDRFLATRASALGAAMRTLSDDQAELLTAALESVLANLTVDRESADHICRMCDEASCPVESCPVECAALQRS